MTRPLPSRLTTPTSPRAWQRRTRASSPGADEPILVVFGDYRANAKNALRVFLVERPRRWSRQTCFMRWRRQRPMRPGLNEHVHMRETSWRPATRSSSHRASRAERARRSLRSPQAGNGSIHSFACLTMGLLGLVTCRAPWSTRSSSSREGDGKGGARFERRGDAGEVARIVVQCARASRTARALRGACAWRGTRHSPDPCGPCGIAIDVDFAEELGDALKRTGRPSNN